MAIKPTEQQMNSQALRERIVRIASELFHQYGYEKVNMREIAAAAGVTTGALYHHFQSKQGLLKASFRHDIGAEDLLQRYSGSVEPEKDLRDFLCELMPEAVIRDGVELTRYRMFSIVRFDTPGIVENCVQLLVEKAVEQGKFTKEIPVSSIVDLFCALYRSASYQYSISESAMNLKEILSERYDVALRAVLASRDK